jgi:hypothetical protein
MSLVTKDARFERLVGHFAGDEIMPQSRFGPGGACAAQTRGRLAIGERILVQDYEQKKDGEVSYQAHAVFHWPDQDCVMHWFDQWAAGAPVEFRGGFEHERLVLYAPFAIAGPLGRRRMVFGFEDAEGYSQALDYTMDGQSWSNFVTGVHRPAGT